MWKIIHWKFHLYIIDSIHQEYTVPWNDWCINKCKELNRLHAIFTTLYQVILSQCKQCYHDKQVHNFIAIYMIPHDNTEIWLQSSMSNSWVFHLIEYHSHRLIWHSLICTYSLYTHIMLNCSIIFCDIPQYFILVEHVISHTISVSTIQQSKYKCGIRPQVKHPNAECN